MPFESLRRQIAEQRAQSEARLLQQDRQRSDAAAAQRREDNIREHNLNSTVVPKLADELAKISSESYSGSLKIKSPAVRQGGGHMSISNMDGTVNIRAGLDGSVTIGEQTLSRREAKDKRRVEAALDDAYRTRQREYESDDGGSW